MKQETFNRCMDYFGYPPGDKKHIALYLVMVEKRSQREASQLSGYAASHLSTVYKRVRTGLSRVKALTGVDFQA